MQLFYDSRDQRTAGARGLDTVKWLRELGATPVSVARPDEAGFLFAGARPIDDYRDLVKRLPGVRDRPEEREPLLRLDLVLDALAEHGVTLPAPKTWRLPLDAPPPVDLTFPLFVRTVTTSWKLGGKISKVRTPKELADEAAELRRAIQWDAVILAREWLDLEPAGHGVYGPVPQEVRVWIIDAVPRAWSFHYGQVVRNPCGFPPGEEDLSALRNLAARVGTAFRSRLVAADFAKLRRGGWAFIEAGPGSCAGTAHESVYKSVARTLTGQEPQWHSDATGGPFEARSSAL